MNAYIQHILFLLRHDPRENWPRRIAEREAAALAGLIMPDPRRTWGPDISHWDGNVNLDVTKAAGAKFVVIKCMDGTVETAYFRANLARAKTAGLLVTGYQWLYPNWVVSCELQALKVWQLTKDLGLTMPIVIDFEQTRYAGQSANPNYTDLDRWVTEYTRLSGKKPILYSGAGFMNSLGRMPETLKAKFFGFWFANYGVSSPTLPLGFTTWDMWQFTSSGDALALAPGDRNKLELDLNYMTELFYMKIGGQVEPPPTGETMQYRVVWENGVARRSLPTVFNSYTGLSYSFGEIVEVIRDNIPDQDDPTNPNKIWVQFADGYYGASQYPNSLGEPKVRMVRVIEPGPEPEPDPTFPPEIGVTINGVTKAYVPKA
jgi:GH25 family lysozyme M1 (1,4-beta-N-acetylmuramidase)